MGYDKARGFNNGNYRGTARDKPAPDDETGVFNCA